jgi:hypothetical protein
MTGANQAMGSRVQHLIFAPHSRTSYLDAVFESIATFVILTNNGFLAASRAGGLPRPFTRPLYSTRGTRAGYNARFVPYFDSSDHMCFVEGAIGVPAVAMVNWDDEFIHSSDDDLKQIDQTQLRRNNFIIGSITHYLAFAEEAGVPSLAGEIYAQGARRLANDLNVALRLLAGSKAEPEAGWKRASIMIEQGILREIRALESARVFVRTNRDAAQTIDALVARTKSRQNELMADIESYSRQLNGSPPKPIQLSPEETAASKRIPANAASLETYFANRDQIGFRSAMHSLMRDEVFNFVDGKRSYYDIYKAVYAEGAAAGSWYYGTMTLRDVVLLLDAAVEAKALTLK